MAASDDRDEHQKAIMTFLKCDFSGVEPISSMQFKRLDKELGAQGKIMVLCIFRDTLKEDLARMPAYGDPGLSSWLHRVKGAVAVMEFDALSSVLDALSQSTDAARQAEHAVLRDLFKELCGMAIKQIDNLLALEQQVDRNR